LCAEIKNYAKRPIMIGIDQEGGRVLRLSAPFSQTPALRVIGATGDVSKAKRVGEILGAELRAANVDIDFAPVVDVDSNPQNPVIGNRSFGREAQTVADMGVAMIGGMQSQGVAACAKHFPGHGDTHQDSHLDLPRVSHGLARLREMELKPFAAAAKANVAAIMTAHIIFEAIDKDEPATMSPKILQGILREEMGYDGVVISDCLEMKAIAEHFTLEAAVVGTVNAGADMVLVCHTLEKQNAAIDLLTAAVKDERVSQRRIAEANRRLDKLMGKYVKAANAATTLDNVIGCAAHREFLQTFEAQDAGIDPTERRA
jgi:beta-N-acetylhexosaminidase